MNHESNVEKPTEGKKRNLKIISEVGALGGPAALVGVVCATFGVTTEKTALLSLWSFLISAAFVYSRLIDRWVRPSLLLIILLFIWAGSSVFWIGKSIYSENKILSETGLIEYFDNANEFLKGGLIQAARNAREEILFFGVSFHISAGDLKPLLIEKLKKGIKIRYLILNPFAPHLNDRSKDFDLTLEEVQRKMKVSINSVLLLQQKWEEIAPETTNPGEVDIRIYNNIPSMRAYLFDPNLESSVSYVVPYINRVNGPTSPGYLIQNKKTGIFSYYHSGVRKIWRESIPLKEFLKQHPDI